MEIKKHIHCPVNGWDCPYWNKNGLCSLTDPMEDCDDFAAIWGEEADPEDYTCDGSDACVLRESEDK